MKKLLLSAFSILILSTCVSCSCATSQSPNYTEEDVANMSEEQIDNARRNAINERKKLEESMPIKEDEALNISLNDLGVSVDDVKVLGKYFSSADDTYSYRIAFIYNNASYNYTIDAKSGSVIERTKDNDPF